MTTQSIRDFIVQFLQPRHQASGQAIDENVNMIERHYCDSLGFLELIAAIEKEYKIQIDFSELSTEEFTTISGLATHVAKCRTQT